MAIRRQHAARAVLNGKINKIDVTSLRDFDVIQLDIRIYFDPQIEIQPAVPNLPNSFNLL